jgi:hypothetical protein
MPMCVLSRPTSQTPRPESVQINAIAGARARG